VNGLSRAIASGAAGALAVTAIHEAGRDRIRAAPRMDVYGKRALRKLGVRRRGKDLERAALVSDLLANAAFYAIAAGGPPWRAPWRGLALGAAAGVGALWLGPRLGIGRWPSRRRDRTAAMTVAWYALGGLASGLVARAIAGPRTPVRDARWEVFEHTSSPSFPALR
jgi:hypothetical protein